MARFEVGNLVQIINPRPNHVVPDARRFVGHVGVILDIAARDGFCLVEGAEHDDKPGTLWWSPRELRLIDGPQETTTWEAVQVITGWNPVKQTEKANMAINYEPGTTEPITKYIDTD